MPRKVMQSHKKRTNQNIKNYLDESSATSNENDDPQINDTFQSPSSHNATNSSSKSRSQNNIKKPAGSRTPSKKKTLTKHAKTPLTHQSGRSGYESGLSTESSEEPPSPVLKTKLAGKYQKAQLNARATEQGGKVQNSARNRPRKTKPKKIDAVLKQIKLYQLSTNYLIPHSPFVALIREILVNEQNLRNSDNWRITLESLQALQEAAELYLVQLFQDAYRCTIHRSRITLAVKDMELVRFLRGRGDVGYMP